MSDSSKITCSNIWKLFGPDEKRVMKELDPKLSIKEVQEKTGHVVAVKDVSFFNSKRRNFCCNGFVRKWKINISKMHFKTNRANFWNSQNG